MYEINIGTLSSLITLGIFFYYIFYFIEIHTSLTRDQMLPKYVVLFSCVVDIFNISFTHRI